MGELRMPSLGSDMQAGTLVAWLRKPGDRVARGDVVAEIETDKGILEVDVFTPGVIEELLVETGAKVPVGTVLARIREEGAAVPAPVSPVPAATAVPAVPAGAPATPAPRGVRVSPAARRRAEGLGLDPATLAGSGEGGAVTLEDVERAAAARPAVPAPPEESAGAVERMRRAVGAAMTRSKREVPHFYVGTTIDLGPALAWLADANGRRTVAERILPAAMLLRATVLALREVPELNARWEGDRVVASEEVRLGVAVSLRGGGLVAPAIPAADRLDLPALMAALRDLVVRARAGRLRGSEVANGTITVTNLGDRGAESVLPVILPPQVAMVGFGRIAERPWVVGGAVVPRPVVRATLAADHRVTDGVRASLFLDALTRLLAEPERP